jgi:23S rRNA (cytosine1962-C5)-methyltransferase
MPTVILKSNKARPIAAGHPWIFSGAIARIDGEKSLKDVVEVRDESGAHLGWGLYSPQSQIRVRMLRTPKDFTGIVDARFFADQLGDARRRRRMLGLPGEQTTGFRLVNSEGDGLPGLIVDVFAELVVFQLTTLPMVHHRDAIVSGIRSAFEDVADLKILEASAPLKIAGLEGFVPNEGWHGAAATEDVWFKEDGVLFGIDPTKFQKTGHFADMRIHRRWVGELSRDRRVLDAYSYTGGFGLQAAAGGARQVICVDSSAAAIETVAKNAGRNGFDQVEAVQSKVDDYLRSAYDRGVRFDVIVLDPPKLAPTKSAVVKALKVYESLCVQALRLLEPGGILCVGSCSEAIGLFELERTLGACTARLERPLSVVYHGAQSPDHPYPAAMTEGHYLTFVAAM